MSHLSTLKSGRGIRADADGAILLLFVSLLPSGDTRIPMVDLFFSRSYGAEFQLPYPTAAAAAISWLRLEQCTGLY